MFVLVFTFSSASPFMFAFFVSLRVRACLRIDVLACSRVVTSMFGIVFAYIWANLAAVIFRLYRGTAVEVEPIHTFRGHR